MDNNSLYHHGIKGMKWGVRRYQNKNGSLTSAGKKRYADKEKEKPKELTTEEKKAKVLNSRSAKELYENRKLFNYDEMNKQQQLLAVDDKVKAMIVEEPDKISKFLTKAGDLAKKIHDVVSPAADTISKVTDLMKKLDPDAEARKVAKEEEEIRLKKESANKIKAEKEKVQAETATENERTRKAKAEADQAESWNKTKDNGNSKSSSGSASKSSGKSKSDVYDVDFNDITNTVTTVIGAGSSVSQLFGSTVKSLPSASSETKSFISDNIAGYLPGPKEDD